MSTASTQISEIPSKKARKTDHDHISNLPDCLISRILSRLPTRDAVRTSVLSKDWEYKWTFIDNIEIWCMMMYKTKKKEATFLKSVERTLLFAQNVQKFQLSCVVNHYTDHVKTWISVALSRNIHCLQIYYRKAGMNIILPRNLLNCYSLRKLELTMPCTFKVPARICYPNLNSLMLEQVEILNELSDSDPVKFDFLVLKTFKLKNCKWLNVKLVEIYAPKMTIFEYETPYGARVNDYSIKISADSLLRFDSYGSYLPENIILSGSPPVVYALFAHHSQDDLEKHGLQIQKLLKGFSSLEVLEIAGCVAKAIVPSKLGLSLPKYYRMKRLDLYSDVTEVLLQLLHAAPFLKFLRMVVTGLSSYDYDAEDYVPSCIVSHLEEVRLQGFEGKKHEFELAKFFLKNALQLKRFSVSTCTRYNCYRPPSPSTLKNEVVEELSAYPRVSTCLTIEVT